MERVRRMRYENTLYLNLDTETKTKEQGRDRVTTDKNSEVSRSN